MDSLHRLNRYMVECKSGSAVLNRITTTGLNRYMVECKYLQIKNVDGSHSV